MVHFSRFQNIFAVAVMIALTTGLLMAGTGDAGAQRTLRKAARPNFDFLSPPSPDANRIYRVNIYSGEMAVCWYDKVDGVDSTRCLPPGPGAGPQERGIYTLVATNMRKEKGVFRVNLVNGSLSVCWVKNDQLVCTPPAN